MIQLTRVGDGVYTYDDGTRLYTVTRTRWESANIWDITTSDTSLTTYDSTLRGCRDRIARHIGTNSNQ